MIFPTSNMPKPHAANTIQNTPVIMHIPGLSLFDLITGIDIKAGKTTIVGICSKITLAELMNSWLMNVRLGN
ncbi:hypothetical protein [Laribacter hongkongensis]|uniref:hypothetical protein n=1 Tax=Laribacter hongkongensis TaxID=168471 RepID=UPI001EFD1CEA|nr:hypothetical protein [Laribacter hongkongensis]MCG9033328.1 hypothetical protein [Laribacter hongkongensis]MCG9093407.1 hypothetical protein [Laribacter hongkongensis]